MANSATHTTDDLCDVADETGLNEDVEESIIREKILGVFWKRGRLGAALYNCGTTELFVLEDTVDVNPDFNRLRTLLSLLEPTEVVTHRSASQLFVSALKSLLHESYGPENGGDASDTVVQNLKLLTSSRAEMSFEACQKTVLTLRLACEPTEVVAEEHELLINSMLNLELESMVSSVAILLRYLEKHLPQVMLSTISWSILNIQHITLGNTVSVDGNTLRALQVFAPQQHPSAFKRGKTQHREGLSLFGLLSRCRSHQGSSRMRELLAAPSRDRDVLTARLDTISFFCRPHTSQVVQSLQRCVGKVRHVSGILTKICQTHANVSHWKTLYTSLYNSILIGQICGQYMNASSLIAKVSESITSEVLEVTNYISQIVDFEESTRVNKFSVNVGIDKHLDSMRQTYANVPEVLLKVAELELKELPDVIEYCSLVCITELGYLLSVPAWLDPQSEISLYELPEMQVKFVVNKFVYYKTPRCRDLDRILGDLIAEMSNVESEMMVVLTQFIRRRVSPILKAVSLIAELDCLLSFADVARERNYVRPDFVDGSSFSITGGRHPLQELCLDTFVPNDTQFGVDEGRIKVLTGPNSSGKSVYLKQVALIAYLAHIGSFVPAESAQIPLLDHIRTRIQTLESVSSDMSAFFIDLKQMLQCLTNSTPKSLIVIDEFGKGTTEIDGQALLAACLSSFANRGGACPIVLASTHFHGVLRILPATPLIKFERMSYVIENSVLVCLHKIEVGVAESSFAHFAAKAAGLTEFALSRSRQFVSEGQYCTPNPRLQITKRMIQTILKMKELFRIVENEALDVEGE